MHHEHDWLIFANTIVNPEDGQGGLVTTAACQRCGEVRSSLSSVDGVSRIELMGECSGTGPSEPLVETR